MAGAYVAPLLEALEAISDELDAMKESREAQQRQAAALLELARKTLPEDQFYMLMEDFNA